MPDRYRFEGRSRNPARDEFNTFLNYAYGVLYSKVEKAYIIAGLDPSIGGDRTSLLSPLHIFHELPEYPAA